MIDGPLRKEIRGALVEAFPSLDALRMFLSEALDVELTDVTPALDPTVAAFDIIQWFLRKGQLPRLIRLAADEKPEDHRIRALAGPFRALSVIDGATRREIREALAEAFPTLDDFRMFVSEEADIDAARAALSPDPSVAIFEVILHCLAGGKLARLVVAAARVKGSDRLRALADRFEESEHAGSFEQVVLKSVPFLAPGDWARRLERKKRAICRIEPQPLSISRGGFGSGFLVAPDVVLTCDHVAKHFPARGPGRVIFRFDYEVDADGVSVSAGRTCGLAEDWALLRSGMDALDFALVRLADRPGEDRVLGGEARGYLEPAAHEFEENEPVFILQHADADPLSMTPGFVLSPRDGERVTYNANTKHGSSGSPCFTFALDLAAVHHWGTPEYNRGVRLASILPYVQVRQEELRRKGLTGVLGLGD